MFWQFDIMTLNFHLIFNCSSRGRNTNRLRDIGVKMGKRIVPVPVPVLQPSSIRELATPWTYFLHSSLSSVILIDSSTESPVHVLMLSIQAVRGLPRLRVPGIVPCIISFSRQLPCFLIV